MALLTEKRSRKAPAPPTDSSPEESDSEGSQNAGSDVEGNTGWADSILNVLKTTKPETNNEIILARGKNIQSAVRAQKSGRSTKEFDFEIDKTTATKEQEEDNDDDDEDVKPEASALDAQLTKQQRKNVPLQLRVKPSYLDMARERTLRKVATQGTVQFFNAVRIQQKNLQQQLEEAGPLDSRQDAVLNNINKRKFLDVLMSGKRAKSTAIDNSVKKEEQESDDDDDEEEEGSSAPIKKKSEWSVLREDFMTNKKIKHWDEEDDDGSDQDGNDDGADDSDDDEDDGED